MVIHNYDIKRLWLNMGCPIPLETKTMGLRYGKKWRNLGVYIYIYLYPIFKHTQIIYFFSPLSLPPLGVP